MNPSKFIRDNVVALFTTFCCYCTSAVHNIPNKNSVELSTSLLITRIYSKKIGKL